MHVKQTIPKPFTRVEAKRLVESVDLNGGQTKLNQITTSDVLKAALGNHRLHFIFLYKVLFYRLFTSIQEFIQAKQIFNVCYPSREIYLLLKVQFNPLKLQTTRSAKSVVSVHMQACSSLLWCIIFCSVYARYMFRILSPLREKFRKVDGDKAWPKNSSPLL